MWVDKDGIETPDGFDGDELDVITGKAQSQYLDEQRRIWGTCNDETIGRDIVRHVLLVVEQYKKVTLQHSLHMAAVGALLLPCPFCGGLGRRRRVLRDGYEHFQNDRDAWAHYVVCRSCAAQGGWAKSVSGAARWWNMRMAEGSHLAQ